MERTQKALKMIGPAVMNGGTTTFLAVILLCDSTSHGLITFFKVFFLTVLFGIFHAIVFLLRMVDKLGRFQGGDFFAKLKCVMFLSFFG